jgi:hypothetical protein
VSEGTRTPDRLDHNQELYQLSYAHHGSVQCYQRRSKDGSSPVGSATLAGGVGLQWELFTLSEGWGSFRRGSRDI